MKRTVSILLLLSGFSLHAADTPAARAGELRITADGSFEYASNRVIFQKNVRAMEPQMNLTCELLTVHFSTNRPGGATNILGAPGEGQKTEMIVAETNVVISQAETRATCAKAVYTTTNELIVLSGEPVVETAQGFLICSNIFFDRRRNKLWGVGGIVMSNKPGVGIFGTESLGISLPGTKRPGRKPDDSSK